MGRPLKTKVSETPDGGFQPIVTRVAKKLKSFSQQTLLEAVIKSFQKTDDEKELSYLAAAVALYLTQNISKYSNANGVYTVIPGKRGRPKKVVEAVAAV